MNYSQQFRGLQQLGSGCAGFALSTTLGSQSWPIKAYVWERCSTRGANSVTSQPLVLYSSCCSLEQGHQERFSLLSRYLEEPQLHSGAHIAEIAV